MVFARMPAIGFHPLALYQAQGFQSAEQRIHGALGDDEIGIAFQAPQDFQAIQVPVPERGQDCQLEAPLAELDLPFIAFRLFHLAYLAIQGIWLSTVIWPSEMSALSAAA